MSESTQPSEQGSKKQHRVEWAVFGVCLALLVALVGTLIYVEVAPGRQGTRLSARVVDVTPGPGGLAVQFEVRNQGGRSVSDVLVGVRLGGNEVQQTLPHLPIGLSRKGTAYFEGAGEGERPTARVLGFMEP